MSGDSGDEERSADSEERPDSTTDDPDETGHSDEGSSEDVVDDAPDATDADSPTPDDADEDAGEDTAETADDGADETGDDGEDAGDETADTHSADETGDDTADTGGGEADDAADDGEQQTVYDFQADEVLGDADEATGNGERAEEDGDGFAVDSGVNPGDGWEEYDVAEASEAAATEEELSESTADDDEEIETVHDPDTTPFERKAGPESDREQPLADHIEEMVKRLGIVIAVAGVVSLAAFPFAEDAITFLWYSVLPETVSQPHVYHPLELLLTQFKVASLVGLIVALPVFVYETYAFMRPGLYPHERRYYLAAVPTSLILALVGVTFAYFIVLPAVMTYFLYYSKDVVDIAFALGQTFNLILILMGYLALVFQIPLFIMLAIMMGLTSREWMEDKRLIFWGVFLGLAFLFSPDPTGMAPLMVAATMVVLFEGTLLLLRWTQRS